MATTINGIPVYDAILGDKEDGMMKISLVDDPAVMSNFQAFDASKPLQMYEVQDEEKRLVRGVIMRCDFPIYRRNKEMGEYYIIYKADTIREMAEKYLVENRQNNVNIMHEEDSDVEGVQMVQFFIKDTEAGINPEGFDVADGSLFGEFHITNDEVWEQVKNGTYKGFSLEGYFDLQPEEDTETIEQIVDSLDGKFKRLFKHSKNKNMSKLARLKAAFAKALAEFENITTDKGILAWDGDDDLKVGDAVFLEDAEGNRTTPEDGDYTTTDGKVIVVADGKVSELKDAVTPTDDVPAEMGKVGTDKGELLWEGEAELKEGDAVFVEKDGENVAAEDGDYKTEDGKVIKVEDGKVASITDAEPEETPTAEQEVKARKQNFFSKVREAFSESYSEKEHKIADVVIPTLPVGTYGYLYEAGDDYAIFNFYSGADWEGKYMRYDVAWDEEGNPVLTNPTEVKRAFVPVDETPSATETELAAVKAENETLKAEIEQFKKTPAAEPAHAVVQTAFSVQKTGDKKLDKLAKMAALAQEAKEFMGE